MQDRDQGLKGRRARAHKALKELRSEMEELQEWKTQQEEAAATTFHGPIDTPIMHAACEQYKKIKSGSL